MNADAEGTHHWPGFGAEAARFLTEQRDIVGVGVDTLSLDVGTSVNFVAHQTLLPAGKYGIELMANLASVPPAGSHAYRRRHEAPGRNGRAGRCCIGPDNGANPGSTLLSG